MQLNEIFDQKYRWKWVQTPKKGWSFSKAHIAYFASEGNFPVKIYVRIVGTDRDEWEITFEVDDATMNMLDKKDPERYSMKPTGLGDQYKIFATVIDILKDFIRRVQPKSVEFTALEPSRIALYKVFINKVKSEIPGYVGEFSHETDVGLFTIRKETTMKNFRKLAEELQLQEKSPPGADAEHWITSNKERFKERYGDDYAKYLYGKAWSLFGEQHEDDDRLTEGMFPTRVTRGRDGVVRKIREPGRNPAVEKRIQQKWKEL